MKDMFTGEYEATLDEEGCINLSVGLLKTIGDAEFTIRTCLIEECLWLFPKSVYQDILTKDCNRSAGGEL